MRQYKIQMINKNSGNIEEDNVDDMIFDDENEAEEYASYMNSCSAQGREDLSLRDPFGYEDEDISDKYEYIAVEI